MAQTVKNMPVMQETWAQSSGWEDPLEKGMETHSSILAWRIPWSEESGGLHIHACVLSHFSRVRLCDPIDCSLPGSSVHGIFQARVLEWVAISFSKGFDLVYKTV